MKKLLTISEAPHDGTDILAWTEQEGVLRAEVIHWEESRWWTHYKRMWFYEDEILCWQELEIPTGKQERLARANKLIRTIASTGHRFFRHKEDVSFFELGKRGHVFFVDSYTKKRIYVHLSNGRWRGFSNGGTLRSLVCALRDWITKGTNVPSSTFGPWPSWYCNGDLWGYGDDMGKVRECARRLGICAETLQEQRKD